MNLFLLLSALIASLTGIARPVMLPGASVVQARQVGALTTPAAAQQAIALVRVAVPAPRPDGYVAPEAYALAIAVGQAVPRLVTPERRRE